MSGFELAAIVSGRFRIDDGVSGKVLFRCGGCDGDELVVISMVFCLCWSELG